MWQERPLGPSLAVSHMLAYSCASFTVGKGYVHTVQRLLKKYIFLCEEECTNVGPARAGPGTPGRGEQPLWAPAQPSQVVAADESPELLGHSVNQFLLVPLIFPKLCEHVVLAASVLHPKQRWKESKALEGMMAGGGRMEGGRVAQCAFTATQG